MRAQMTTKHHSVAQTPHPPLPRIDPRSRISGYAICLEAKSRRKAGREGKKEIRIPVAQLAVDDRFALRPGEKIATDGTVVEGVSAVAASMLTVDAGGRLIVEDAQGRQRLLPGVRRDRQPPATHFQVSVATSHMVNRGIGRCPGRRVQGPHATSRGSSGAATVAARTPSEMTR